MRPIRKRKVHKTKILPPARAIAAMFAIGMIAGLLTSGIVMAFVGEEKEELPQTKQTNKTTKPKIDLTPHITMWEQSLKSAKVQKKKTNSSPYARIDGQIQRNETLFGALVRSGISEEWANKVVVTMRDVMDLRKIHPKEKFTAYVDPATGEVHTFEYHKNRTTTYLLRNEGGKLVHYVEEKPTKVVVVPIAGEVRTSLAQAIAELGESPALTEMVADVFAWDINFYSDSRKGDKFRLLVEKIISEDGQFVRYGRLLAAEYEGYFTGPKYAFLYSVPGKDRPDYFDETGSSLRRSFLKAPVSTVRITSLFGFRKHPILGKRRPHLGVDFGAPRGTPVWAVADGTVIRAGRRGGCGNEIFLQHSMGYRTRYCHLQKIFVHRGERVYQKQVIGLVGSTGLSTGPHLHFELHYHGHPVNPLKQRFKRGKPVPKKYKDEYMKLAQELRMKLFSIPWPKRIGPEPYAEEYDGEPLWHTNETK